MTSDFSADCHHGLCEFCRDNACWHHCHDFEPDELDEEPEPVREAVTVELPEVDAA